MLYNIDATKLSKAGKEVKKGGFDRIVFNFPHVGGLTKDVNRQVRHNQGIKLRECVEEVDVAQHGLMCWRRTSSWLPQVRASFAGSGWFNCHYNL